MTDEYEIGRWHHYGTDYHAEFVIYRCIHGPGDVTYISEWLIPGTWDE